MVPASPWLRAMPHSAHPSPEDAAPALETQWQMEATAIRTKGATLTAYYGTQQTYSFLTSSGGMLSCGAIHCFGSNCATSEQQLPLKGS